MALDFALPIPMAIQSKAAITIETWTPVNPTGLPFGIFFISLNNASDEGVGISYDGVTAHDYIFAGTSKEIPFQTNAAPNSQKCVLKAGTIVYIQGIADADGYFYLSGWYQPSNIHDIVGG